MEDVRVEMEVLREAREVGMEERWEAEVMMERWDREAREWRERVVDWEVVRRAVDSVWVIEDRGREVRRER